MASRTMTLKYRGTSIVVREGHEGALQFEFDEHTQTPEAKTFEAATNEARKWLLKYAGEMKGNYERSSLADLDQRDRNLRRIT